MIAMLLIQRDASYLLCDTDPESIASLKEGAAQAGLIGQTQILHGDATGRKPVLEWLRNKVSISTRRVVGTALHEILQEQGMGVCGTAFGRQLGGGLFEFRLRESDLLLRAFCHAYGDR
jgi:hypothetical protein